MLLDDRLSRVAEHRAELRSRRPRSSSPGRATHLLRPGPAALRDRHLRRAVSRDQQRGARAGARADARLRRHGDLRLSLRLRGAGRAHRPRRRCGSTPEVVGGHPPRGRHRPRHVARRPGSARRWSTASRRSASACCSSSAATARSRRDEARRRDRAARAAHRRSSACPRPSTTTSTSSIAASASRARSAAAVDVIRSAHVEATGARNGIGLVKLMGRHSGFIACHAALASTDVDVVLIPEVPMRLEGETGCCAFLERRLEQRLARRHRRRRGRRAGAVRATSARRERARTRAATCGSSDIGVVLRDRIVEHFREREERTITLKYIDPSYQIRSVPASPTDSFIAGTWRATPSTRRWPATPEMLIGRWHGRFVHVPMPLATRFRKQVDTSGRSVDVGRRIHGTTHRMADLSGNDSDRPLREDIRLLGRLLGDTLRVHQEGVPDGAAILVEGSRRQYGGRAPARPPARRSDTGRSARRSSTVWTSKRRSPWCALSAISRSSPTSRRTTTATAAYGKRRSGRARRARDPGGDRRPLEGGRTSRHGSCERLLGCASISPGAHGAPDRGAAQEHPRSPARHRAVCSARASSRVRSAGRASRETERGAAPRGAHAVADAQLRLEKPTVADEIENGARLLPVHVPSRACRASTRDSRTCCREFRAERGKCRRSCASAAGSAATATATRSSRTRCSARRCEQQSQLAFEHYLARCTRSAASCSLSRGSVDRLARARRAGGRVARPVRAAAATSRIGAR